MACAWRGLTLDYLLLGPVIVTGEDHGVAVTLPAALERQVRQAAATVTSVLGEFQRRGAPPGESEQVIEEMLTLVRHVTS